MYGVMALQHGKHSLTEPNLTKYCANPFTDYELFINSCVCPFDALYHIQICYLISYHSTNLLFYSFKHCLIYFSGYERDRDYANVRR